MNTSVLPAEVIKWSELSGASLSRLIVDPSRRWLAALGFDGRLRVWGLSESLRLGGVLLDTAASAHRCNVRDFGWTSGGLLYARVNGVASPEEAEPYPDRYARLRSHSDTVLWDPATGTQGEAFDYAAELIMPDRSGKLVALFDRTVDILARQPGTTTVTIAETETFTVVRTFVWQAMEEGDGWVTRLNAPYPLFWDRSQKCFFAVAEKWGPHSTRRNTTVRSSYPVLLAVSLSSGAETQLTGTSVTIAGKYRGPVLNIGYGGRPPGSFPAPLTKHGELAVLLGSPIDDTLRVGYFSSQGVLREVGIPRAQWPVEWRYSGGGEYDLGVMTVTPDGSAILSQTRNERTSADGALVYPLVLWDMRSSSALTIGWVGEITQLYDWCAGGCLTFATEEKTASDARLARPRREYGIVVLGVSEATQAPPDERVPSAPR